MTDNFVINLDIDYEIGKLITDIDTMLELEIVIKQVTDDINTIIASDK